MKFLFELDYPTVQRTPATCGTMSTSMQSHPIPFRIRLFVPSVVDLERRQFKSIATAIHAPTITKFNACIYSALSVVGRCLTVNTT